MMWYTNVISSAYLTHSTSTWHNRSALTQHAAVTVAHGVVAKVVILHVVGFLGEDGGTGLRLQEQVGFCGAVHDVLLKRTGVTHHLAVIHAKVSWK